jgi:NO-binding membrane sensor protein with MHYT domain
MAWWKWALVFLSGVVLGAVLWAVSDLALLGFRGDMDLRAEDNDGNVIEE